MILHHLSTKTKSCCLLCSSERSVLNKHALGECLRASTQSSETTPGYSHRFTFICAAACMWPHLNLVILSSRNAFYFLMIGGLFHFSTSVKKMLSSLSTASWVAILTNPSRAEPGVLLTKGRAQRRTASLWILDALYYGALNHTHRALWVWTTGATDDIVASSANIDIV